MARRTGLLRKAWTPRLAAPVTDTQGERRHALVIGGGLAGLVTAKVLSLHFARVTLLERDGLSDGPARRRGVPQAPHQHVLLARGRLILEGLFPGLGAQLMTAGTKPLDVADELAYLTPAGWSPRFRSGIAILPCSRELLEWCVRARVAADPRVEVRDGHEATGLLGSEAGDIDGIRARPTGRRDLAGFEIGCDLVVDASGRGSHLPQWLGNLGRGVPSERVVDAHLGYASRVYKGLPVLPDGLRGAFIQAAPPAFTRGGAMLPIEGGRTLVTLLGRSGDHPPTEDAGFLEYARTLRSPLIYEAIAALEPASPIAASRSTENRWRHYERLRDWPDRLVVLGDAACALNPVYGQGMTTGAMAATTLGRLLSLRREESLVGFGAQFQRTLARINSAPWMFDTDLDLLARGTSGPPPGHRVRARQAYLARVGRLGTTSPEVRRAFLEVFHLINHPRSLLRPRVLLPIAQQAVTDRRQPGRRGSG